jgi:hypothetical protein
VSNSSYTPRCRHARKWGSRSSFDRTGTVNREA